MGGDWAIGPNRGQVHNPPQLRVSPALILGILRQCNSGDQHLGVLSLTPRIYCVGSPPVEREKGLPGCIESTVVSSKKSADYRHREVQKLTDADDAIEAFLIAFLRRRKGSFDRCSAEHI
jgi:hypothetical protein